MAVTRAQPSRRVDQFEILYDLTSAMALASRSEDVYEPALDALFRGTSCARAAFLLFDADGVMRFTASRGLSEAYRHAVEGHTPWTRDTRDPRPIIVQDVETSEDLRAHRDTILREGIRGLTFIPLTTGQQVIGKFMIYYDTVRVVSEDELRLAETIARHVAFAIERGRANQQLLRAEQWFRQLAMRAPVGIFQTDARGDSVFVNERYCELTGRSPDQAAGTGWIEAIHPDDRDRVFTEWYDAAQNGREFKAEHRLQTPDGRVLWVAGAAVPLKDAEGRVTQYLGTLTDITARKLSEEALARSERRFRTLADAAPALIWYDDAEGNCQFVNQYHLNFFGKMLAEVQGRAWQPLLHPDDSRAYLEAWRGALAERKPFTHRTRVKRHDGEWRWIESHALPLFGNAGEFLGIVGISPDITEAVTAERRKDEFLATLAHELRNPLAAIRNGLQVLGMSQAAEPHRLHVHAILRRQVEQLTRLVDDLLDISRITQNKITLHKERVSIGSVITDAVDTSRSLFEAAGQTLTVMLPPERMEVEADRTRLAQVFWNLLSNAAKFTPSGGKVWLTVERDGSDVVVIVRDTGAGITAEQLPHIFDMFSQGEGAEEHTEDGLGIGLCLARGLIGLHGGKIEARSAGPGQGSEFIVRVPLRRADGEEAFATASSSPAHGDAAHSRKHTAARVLIVEDNPDSADVLDLMLRMAGHEIRCVRDGPNALKIADSFLPSVVVLDIGLPGMSGYEVARQIRKRSWADRVLLIAVTGWGQAEDQRRAMEAGFDMHLTKPVDPEALMRLLAEARHDTPD
jgi:PAS domain S-box-containing protein